MDFFSLTSGTENSGAVWTRLPRRQGKSAARVTLPTAPGARLGKRLVPCPAPAQCGLRRAPRAPLGKWWRRQGLLGQLLHGSLLDLWPSAAQAPRGSSLRGTFFP